MIWESAPWKNELLKDASLLERWASKTSKPNQRALIFEKKVFMAAYAVRKLFEAQKVCTSLHERPVPCFSYPRTDSNMTAMNWHRIDEHFDWKAGKATRITATALVNQIIHSLIFMLKVDGRNHVEGFFVLSHQGKKRQLFSVELRIFLDLITEIGHDYPTKTTSTRDDDWQWRTVLTCPDHPGD